MLSSTTISQSEVNKEKKNYRFTQPQDLKKDINWEELVVATFPHYVASKISPLLLTIESMLRIYYLQKLYSMSATEAEHALLHIDALREFAFIDLDCEAIPDASCIEDFNSLFVNKILSSKIEQAFNIKPISTD